MIRQSIKEEEEKKKKLDRENETSEILKGEFKFKFNENTINKASY